MAYIKKQSAYHGDTWRIFAVTNSRLSNFKGVKKMSIEKYLAVLGLVAGVAASGGAWAGISDGLVGYWNFDNCDASGTGGAGGIKGTPSCVAGIAGKSLQFANSNNTGYFDKKDYVVLPNFTATTFTVSLWAKYIQTSNFDPNGGIWSAGDDTNSPMAAIFLNSDTGEVWGTLTPTSGGGKVTSKKIINDNKFHLLTLTADSTNLTFYVDGQLVGSASVGQTTSFSNSPQYLAYHQWYNGSAGSSRFNGLIDDVRIYNHALSETEIQQLYSGASTCDTTTPYNQGYSAAQVACKANPSSCGITASTSGSTVTTTGHATYTPSSNLVHIPYLDVPTLFGGTPTVYEVDLTVMPNTNPLQLKLQNAKQVQ